MLSPCLPPTYASIAEHAVIARVRFDTPIGQSGENPRVIVLEDTLYLFSRREGRILSWTMGQDAMTPFVILPQAPAESMTLAYKDMDSDKKAQMEAIVTHVLAGNGTLWGLNQYSGRFGEIDKEGVIFTHTLDLGDLNPPLNTDADYRFAGFVSEDYLYLFSVMRKDAFIARYSLTNGERQDIALSHSLGVAYPYDGGRALYAADIQTGAGSGGYAESIHTLDLATGALTPMTLSLPKGAKGNTTTYIKRIYPINATDDLYCFVESGSGEAADSSVLVFDKSGALKTRVALPLPENGFYYLCQPIGAQKIIAVDAFGAAVLGF